MLVLWLVYLYIIIIIIILRFIFFILYYFCFAFFPLVRSRVQIKEIIRWRNICDFILYSSSDSFFPSLSLSICVSVDVTYLSKQWWKSRNTLILDIFASFFSVPFLYCCYCCCCCRFILLQLAFTQSCTQFVVNKYILDLWLSVFPISKLTFASLAADKVEPEKRVSCSLSHTFFLVKHLLNRFIVSGQYTIR